MLSEYTPKIYHTLGALSENTKLDVYDGANYTTLIKKINFRGKLVNLKSTYSSPTRILTLKMTHFATFMKSPKTADIIEYEGHSGLGANLSLKKLEIKRLSKKKYQLYFFNACSTYKYFNNEYLKAKGGSKNLDIILSGFPLM